MAPVFEWCSFHISVVTRGADFWNHCYESHRMSWGRSQSRVVREHSGPEGLTAGRLSLLSLLSVGVLEGLPSAPGCLFNPGCRDPVAPGRRFSQFTVKLQWLTQIKSARTKGIWEPKVILDCRKLEPCRSVFLSGASGSFFSQGFCAVNG